MIYSGPTLGSKSRSACQIELCYPFDQEPEAEQRSASMKDFATRLIE
jgi:hypothetical protein